MSEEQSKAIETLIRAVNKTYGDNSMYSFGKVKPVPVECVPTGSLALDFAIGGKEKFMGIPMGRITELWGPKDSGKTTLCNHIIANAQRMGKPTFYFDFEHSYDPFYAKAIGVDIDKLIFSQGSELEQGWMIVESVMHAVPGSVIVIDSIAAMSPRTELEAEMDDDNIGRQAKKLAQAMRRNMGRARESGTAIVCTNQVRHIIGAGKGRPTETSAGGEAFRHALSLKINLYPSKMEKVGGEVVARTVIATVKHSKIARPYGKATYRLEFGKGVDTVPELITFGVMAGALESKGAYYYMSGVEKFFAQGADSAAKYMRDNPEIAADVRKTITEYVVHEEEENAEV